MTEQEFELNLLLLGFTWYENYERNNWREHYANNELELFLRECPRNMNDLIYKRNKDQILYSCKSNEEIIQAITDYYGNPDD